MSWCHGLSFGSSDNQSPSTAPTDEDWLRTYNRISGSEHIFYSDNSVNTGEGKATFIAQSVNRPDLSTLMDQIKTGLAEAYDDPTKRENWRAAVIAAYNLSKQNMPKIAFQLSEAAPAMHFYGVLSETPDPRSQPPSFHKERVEAFISRAMEEWKVECQKNPEAGAEVSSDSAGSC
jgi:wyosine [tRNA(Phe)-imidazoG37] synthetase (radical SAM superfamily)